MTNSPMPITNDLLDVLTQVSERHKERAEKAEANLAHLYGGLAQLAHWSLRFNGGNVGMFVMEHGEYVKSEDIEALLAHTPRNEP